MGMHPDQDFKVMSFLTSYKAKVNGLARLCRGLKQDRAWEIMPMYLENSIVDDTKSMFVSDGFVLVSLQ